MAAPSMEAELRGGDWVRFLDFEGNSVGYYDGEDIGCMEDERAELEIIWFNSILLGSGRLPAARFCCR